MDKKYALEDFDNCLAETLDSKDYDCYREKLYKKVEENFLKTNNSLEISYLLADSLVQYGEDYADFDDADEWNDTSDDYYFFGKEVLSRKEMAVKLPSGKVLEVIIE